MKILYILIALVIILQSCSTDIPKSRQIKTPTVVDEVFNVIEPFDSTKINNFLLKTDSIENYDYTDYSITLESRLNSKHNSIYAVPFIYAWHEIKKEIGDKIKRIESKNLKRLNNSRTYKNVLNPDEYKTTIKHEGDEITATAEFFKSLSFYEPLTEFNKPFKFKNTNVKSFGFYREAAGVSIAYYVNDKNFAIKFRPIQNEHEIILILTKNKKKSFLDYYTLYENQIEKFKLDSIRWKHQFTNLDKVIIPNINFNLSYNFPSITNTSFSTNTMRVFNITKAYQKTAFVLNHNGAAIRSKAELTVVESACDAIEQMKPEPKNMIFNTDFVLFLKRKDADLPYFGLSITNDELLEKFPTND